MYIDLVMPEVRRPEVVVRNVYGQYLDRNYRMVSYNDASVQCLNEEELVIKPTIETTGAKT